MIPRKIFAIAFLSFIFPAALHAQQPVKIRVGIFRLAACMREYVVEPKQDLFPEDEADQRLITLLAEQHVDVATVMKYKIVVRPKDGIQDCNDFWDADGDTGVFRAISKYVRRKIISAGDPIFYPKN